MSLGLLDRVSLIREIRENGIARIQGYLTKEAALQLKADAEVSKTNFERLGGAHNNNSIYIANAFTYKRTFYQVATDVRIHSVIRELIGDASVLLTNSLINITYTNGEGSAAGGDWHTDSRYINGGRTRVGEGFTYLVFVLFEEWKSGSATRYIPKSHIWTDRPAKDEEYETQYSIKYLCGNPGDLFILDGGIWHKAGIASAASRWGMVSLYGPWFVKPYFDFTEFFSSDIVSKMADHELELFHFTSIPPMDQFIRPSLNTVIRPADLRATYNT